MEENNIQNVQNVPKKNNSILIVIIVILVLIIVGLLAGFFFINNKSKENTNNQPASDNNTVESENNEVKELPEKNSNTYKVSNKWDEYVISINNTAIKLPYSYKDFKTVSGLAMKDIEEKNYLESNYYKLENLYKNDKLALYIEVINDTKEAIQGIDTKITRVSQTKYMVTSGSDPVIFPGNLTVNKNITKDELVALFGEPNDIKNFSDNNYNKDTYKYYSDETYTTFNYFQIDVVNGVIDEITLDHRSY